MSNLIVNQEDISKNIFSIRDRQVMLDSDLAVLYQIETKQLNRVVKRNIDRFPDRFMFQLTQNEWENLRYQIGTSSMNYGGRRYLPNGFTEQGVAMLSAVIKSDVAIKVSIQIMETFIEMRKTISKFGELLNKVTEVENRQDASDLKFEKIFKALESVEEIPHQGIFYNGQIFDSYKFISDIIRTSNHSIILIDNYIDESTLIHLTKRKEKVQIIIYTKKPEKSLLLDIKKFTQQYKSIIIRESNIIHDRFLIIDNKVIFHLGASLKDLGKKIFAFSKMNIDVIELLSKLEDVNH